MTQWPFELPPMPLAASQISRDGLRMVELAFREDDVRAYADACIAAALRWAAEQCELGAWEPCDCGCPGKKRPQSPQAVGQIRAAHRIRDEKERQMAQFIKEQMACS